MTRNAEVWCRTHWQILCQWGENVVDTKLTLSDPSHSLADSSSSGESVRLPLGWICFVYFLFSFVVYVICLFQVLMPACLSLLSIVWNKCARHAGSGQCFRPALFWRHHTRLGVQYFWVVTACGRSYLYWFVSATTRKLSEIANQNLH